MNLLLALLVKQVLQKLMQVRLWMHLSGRNPRTGETIKIKARVQPKFKAGKTLQDAVN